jgi:hypothetical protein
MSGYMCGQSTKYGHGTHQCPWAGRWAWAIRVEGKE